MSARSERFNASMASVDWVDGEFDPSKDPRQSDGGLGVERMVASVDFDWASERASWSWDLGQRNASVVGAVLRLVWTRSPSSRRF